MECIDVVDFNIAEPVVRAELRGKAVAGTIPARAPLEIRGGNDIGPWG
jgi:hypothetical protein